ncbi:uncharacterized protein STEHIDRAFT_65204, partial [Stereum hirsutum FP-91666 SS1]|uniref:uncharacterized protein n=1 Tax=Stereum hirsutum (strain FP-91666) TaxID=721885 RepID=UPI0004449E7A
FPDLSHPARTMVNIFAYGENEKMQKILNTQPPNSLDLDASTWREIWPRLFVTHCTMWSWDIGCSDAREYIAHMLVSARLAEHFEEGKVIDDSLYAEIVR